MATLLTQLANLSQTMAQVAAGQAAAPAAPVAPSYEVEDVQAADSNPVVMVSLSGSIKQPALQTLRGYVRNGTTFNSLVTELYGSSRNLDSVVLVLDGTPTNYTGRDPIPATVLTANEIQINLNVGNGRNGLG